MAQPLGQMFCGRCNSKLVANAALGFHDPSQRIVFSSSFTLIEEKLLDLFIVFFEKCSVQVNKSARFAGANLGTGRADYYLGGAPMFVALSHSLRS